MGIRFHTSSEEAEGYLQRALHRARDQRALSWEFRAAMSLARLWREENRAAAAAELLSDVYGRFTEGFNTADVRDARALIGALG